MPRVWIVPVDVTVPPYARQVEKMTDIPGSKLFQQHSTQLEDIETRIWHDEKQHVCVYMYYDTQWQQQLQGGDNEDENLNLRASRILIDQCLLELPPPPTGVRRLLSALPVGNVVIYA